jgi:3-methyladenine DNA glycosylase AlkD
MAKSKVQPSAVTAVSLRERVVSLLAGLEKLGSKKAREEMVTRYGIHAAKAHGVPMTAMQKMARGLGRDHALAAALWETGWYEARTVAALIDDPLQVTPAQMDRWCRDFDNWAICDTVCFKLFDSTPHAFEKIKKWAGSREEFVRRAAFALLASVALHDRKAADRDFAACFSLIEKAADDERNFVKKAVNWALRAIGERSPALHTAAITLGQRLADSPNTTERWIGKDAVKQLSSAAVQRRLAGRS